MTNRTAWVLFLLLIFAGCQRTSVRELNERGAGTTKLALRENAMRLVKEPDYASTPMYSLLVFGENAQHQHWLVVDGKTVFLDRNGNGDLTEPEDQILLDEKATAAIHSGGEEYSGFNVFPIGDLAGHTFAYHVWVLNAEFEPEPDENELLTKWRHQRAENGWMNSTLYRISNDRRVQIPITLCPDPQNVQISHVGGPLTFNLKWGDRQCLEREGENIFEIKIGTAGEPTKYSQYPAFSNLCTQEVPKDIHPIAKFNFTSNSKEHDTVSIVVNLDQRC